MKLNPLGWLLGVLREPLLASMDVDTEERLRLHQHILNRKQLLREMFSENHSRLNELSNEYLEGRGIEVELGAGVAPMRDHFPNVLATDIVPTTTLDKALDAEDLDLEDSSVRVFYAQNCFHHFPHPSKFFIELDRTLVTGGGAIILEPYYGPLSSLIYKNLFKTEGFDKEYPGWETPSSGPMNGANQALSYIVFIRDQTRFKLDHPSLEIVHQCIVGNYLKYLLSGGLNFKQMLPDRMTRVVGVIEKLLSPLNRWLGLHHIIVIKKIEC